MYSNCIYFKGVIMELKIMIIMREKHCPFSSLEATITIAFKALKNK